MSRTIPSASLRESLGFFTVQILPNVRQGLFKRRPDAVERNIQRENDRRAVAAAGRLRDKYGDLVWVRVPVVFHALLVLGPQGVRHVLDRSPEVYADPPTKRKGMSHFQPHAVTISRGEAWKDRRRFNEAALATPSRLHPHAAKFLAAVREEVDAQAKSAPRELAWKDFEDLFERITLRVLFGDGARDDHALAGHLSSMMEEANERNPKGPSSHFQPFNQGVGRYLEAAAPGSLAESASKVPAGPDTRPAGQFPHWMFAMKDTTATNTARALALILAHPEAERRVREEITAADLASPEGIDGLRYLEACVHEAMRLWPTTPLLSREALRDDSIDGAPVPKGSQVI
ncbi:MAG: cytochrome P450, partial [Thermoanaerobaculia bacterium]